MITATRELRETAYTHSGSNTSKAVSSRTEMCYSFDESQQGPAHFLGAFEPFPNWKQTQRSHFDSELAPGQWVPFLLFHL